ncbi:MAG: hypothetical protein PVG32_11270 [Anaerolineales bacterium]
MKKILTAVIIATVLFVLPAGSMWIAMGAPQTGPGTGAALKVSTAGVIPTFAITAVEEDVSVTIQTDNFPADDTFVVTMGAMGTRGIGGVQVATTDSGDGGRFTKTYSIPSKLHGAYQIAIRLESPTSGYYAYNWFYNSDANVENGDDSNGDGDGTPVYSGFPTFDILSVVAGESVTIEGHNFPPDDSFQVRMNWMGTRGVAGAIVDTYDLTAGGSFTETFSIPDFLKNAYQIAMRLESPTSGYYAYNWFYNTTAVGGEGDGEAPVPPGYTGFPTFSILAVERDESVTIKAQNFPPTDTFKVKMNWMGTRGVGGKVVETVETGEGGSFEDTYTIPAFLYGQYKIAIRLESPSSGYYAYNWFYNNTTLSP